MEDPIGKEKDGLTETGDKAKGEEVAEEVEEALEEETEVEEGKLDQAGTKWRCVLHQSLQEIHNHTFQLADYVVMSV